MAATSARHRCAWSDFRRKSEHSIVSISYQRFSQIKCISFILLLITVSCCGILYM